jgi:hypothetical protein
MPIQGDGMQTCPELPHPLGVEEPASNALELQHAIGGFKGKRIARQNPLQQWVQRPCRHRSASGGPSGGRHKSGPKRANNILSLS